MAARAPSASIAAKNTTALRELCGHWGGLLLYRLGAAAADANYASSDVDYARRRNATAEPEHTP
jgi:hypothetical protein